MTEDIDTETYLDCAFRLQKLGAISEYDYAECDGHRFLVVELSRKIPADSSNEE